VSRRRGPRRGAGAERAMARSVTAAARRCALDWVDAGIERIMLCFKMVSLVSVCGFWGASIPLSAPSRGAAAADGHGCAARATARMRRSGHVRAGSGWAHGPTRERRAHPGTPTPPRARKARGGAEKHFAAFCVFAKPSLFRGGISRGPLHRATPMARRPHGRSHCSSSSRRRRHRRCSSSHPPTPLPRSRPKLPRKRLLAQLRRPTPLRPLVAASSFSRMVQMWANLGPPLSWPSPMGVEGEELPWIQKPSSAQEYTK
jgi:hypothetical protein